MLALGAIMQTIPDISPAWNLQMLLNSQRRTCLEGFGEPYANNLAAPQKTPCFRYCLFRSIDVQFVAARGRSQPEE